MPPPEVPSWIRLAHGTAPILVLAPHGGRRRDARIPGARKVNDLWTADVAFEIAQACEASAVVNDGMDRNVLDLNRLSQVRGHAPWFLELVHGILADMIDRTGRATVLVVHGWNVTQPACDVGVGFRDGETGPCPVRPGAATVSHDFLATWFRRLQREGDAAGIHVTLGSRYPAAHPNNLLELFRIMPADDAPPCPIAALRTRGLVEAAQLELTIPVRWPGARRARLVRMLADSFAPAPRATTSVSRPGGRTVLRTGAGRVVDRLGLQFLAGEALVMASIEAGDAGAVGGRLVISAAADRLALFTGELVDPGAAWRVPPLAITAHPTGELHVGYEGPLVAFASHTPFLDLERGLEAGCVVEGTLDVCFRPERSGLARDSGEVFGRVEGVLRFDGHETRVAAVGLAVRGPMPLRRRMPSCRVSLSCSPWGPLVLETHPNQPLRAGFDRWRGELAARTEGGIMRVEVDVAVREGLIRVVPEPWQHDRAAVTGILERVIPVRRPGKDGGVVETTFAVVRIAETCVGWIELTAPVSAAPP